MEKQQLAMLRRISDGFRVGEQIAIMSEVPELEDYILSGELHSAQEWIDAFIANPKPTRPAPMQKLGSLLAACAEMTWARGYYFLSMRFDALAVDVKGLEDRFAPVIEGRMADSGKRRLC